MLNECRNGTASEAAQAIMYNCKIEGREVVTVPMGLLVQLGSVVDFNVPMLETVFAKIGMPYTREQFADRLDRAKFWLEECAPDQVNRLRATRNWAVWNTLSDSEKQAIRMLFEKLRNGEYTPDSLNTLLYDIPKAI